LRTHLMMTSRELVERVVTFTGPERVPMALSSPSPLAKRA